MPSVLRSAGHAVELHSAHFESNVADEVWIRAVGQKKWIILTKDRHIKNNQIEIEALMASGTPTFTLMSADTTGAENAATFLTALPTILQFVGKFHAPFVAGITKAGKVNLLMPFSQMIKSIR